MEAIERLNLWAILLKRPEPDRFGRTLTAEQVRAARLLYAQGCATAAELAEWLKLSRASIYKMLKRESYRWV